MKDTLVPADVKLAAKRGFLRTTMQGYEATLAGSIAVNAVVALARGELDTLTVAVTAVVAVVSPPLAGLRSWLSITRNGIPVDYAAAQLDAHELVSEPSDETPEMGDSAAAAG